MSETHTRKIFISYSWSSTEHKAAVVELAEKLMADGVEVIIDVWEVREGHDLISFMEKMVTDTSVHKVLMICDHVYAQKANDRKGGVGIESQIISPEIYKKVDQSKFIPVVFEHDDDGAAFLPVFLTSRFYVDLASVEKKYENYDQLLRAILDQPLHKKPKLGKTPSHLLSEGVEHTSTRYQFERVRNALVGGKPQTTPLIQDYLRLKVENLDSYRIGGQGVAHDFDDLIVDSIKSMLPYRDELVEFFSLLTAYKNEPETYEEIADFFQSALSYHHPPKGMNSWMTIAFDNYRFLTYELFLYFIAVLIKAKRFDEAHQFLQREFYVTDSHGNDRFWGFAALRPYLDSIEVQRKQRLKLNRISVMADLLKESATRRDIGFSELAEADAVLYLRSYLQKSRSQIWYPNTVIYREMNGGPAKLFRMSESSKYFSALKVILGVDPAASGQSLLQQFLFLLDEDRILRMPHEPVHRHFARLDGGFPANMSREPPRYVAGGIHSFALICSSRKRTSLVSATISLLKLGMTTPSSYFLSCRTTERSPSLINSYAATSSRVR